MVHMLGESSKARICLPSESLFIILERIGILVGEQRNVSVWTSGSDKVSYSSMVSSRRARGSSNGYSSYPTLVEGERVVLGIVVNWRIVWEELSEDERPRFCENILERSEAFETAEESLVVIWGVAKRVWCLGLSKRRTKTGDGMSGSGKRFKDG